ncbi:MAG: cardiolipin synthase [Patescibacteria group bacterium]
MGLISSVGVIWLALNWLIIVMALFVVPRNRKPTAGTAWLLLIFFFPIFGIILYLILGNPKLPKARRDAQKTLNGLIDSAIKDLKKHRDSSGLLEAEVPQKYESLAKLSTALSHLPVFEGNHVELIPEYNNVIDQIVNDIDNAEHYVHLEYFIIAIDDITLPIFDALASAVKRGVIARVMYDSFATHRYPRWKEMIKRLESDGVIVQAMLPFKLPTRGYVRPDLRNHRKLVVIDGHTGYTGSLNLVQRDYHRKDEIYYDEMVVRMQGPIVLQLAAVFVTDWYSETGELLDYRTMGVLSSNIKSYGDSLAQVLPSGPGYENENNLKLFTALIHRAQKKIIITNPYFVPDDALTTAITSAAIRGVEVIMINSEVMDQKLVGHAQRSFYESLLKVGVKIYWYNSPVLLHSKFMTIDGEVATIGSSNLDIRSFILNLEVTLISYDAKVVRNLNKIEAKYIKNSKQVTLEQWRQRPKRQQLFDNIARLTSALQ